MNRLDGKVAFISGAARGIGAATATLLVARGARVVLVDLDDEPAAAASAPHRPRCVSGSSATCSSIASSIP